MSLKGVISLLIAIEFYSEKGIYESTLTLLISRYENTFREYAGESTDDYTVEGYFFIDQTELHIGVDRFTRKILWMEAHF